MSFSESKFCIACISCPTSGQIKWEKNQHVNIFKWNMNFDLYHYICILVFHFGVRMCSGSCVTLIIVLL